MFDPRSPVISTPHGEDIPNFAASPTISSVADGAWSDPAVWDTGSIPGPGDIVAIAHNVELSGQGQAAVVGVEPSGQLSFDVDADSTLTVTTLLVMPGGVLEMGTEALPVTGSVEVVINDVAPDTTADPKQFGTGVLVIDGEWHAHGRPLNATFTRLASDPMALDGAITVDRTDLNWQPGDRLVVPDTQELPLLGRGHDPAWQDEVRTLMAVDSDTLTLSSPLDHNHFGITSGTGQTFRAHVANLTRNITIRSANPAGNRGHVLCYGGATLDINYTAFVGLGRTTVGPLDALTPSANQRGRYSLHLHHVYGPTPPLPSGYQFRVLGCVFEDGLRWGLTLHDTHYGLVSENVCYDIDGAAIVTEDGSETGNVFDSNITIRNDGVTEDYPRRTVSFREDNGFEGNGFWFRGQRNTVTNNVAANAKAFGFYSFLRWGNVGVSGPRDIPMFQGANPLVPGEAEIGYDTRFSLFDAFDNNEAYACRVEGFTFWYCRGVFITNVISWANASVGVSLYYPGAASIDGLEVLGRSSIATGVLSSNGLFPDLGNFNIEGQAVGLSIVPRQNQPVVKNGRLDNARDIVQPDTARDNEWTPCIIENVEMLGGGLLMEGGHIRKNPLFAKCSLYIRDHQKQPGANYQVWFPQQDPAFIVPQDRTLHFDPYRGREERVRGGHPEAGQTNQHWWDNYGQAMDGAVMDRLEIPLPEVEGVPTTGEWTDPITLTCNIQPWQTISGPTTIEVGVEGAITPRVFYFFDAYTLARRDGAQTSATWDFTPYAKGSHFLRIYFVDRSQPLGRIINIPVIVA